MSKKLSKHSLADLAARIKAEHHAVGLSARQTLRHALAAGDLLLEAKQIVGHGGFGDWLRDHCEVSQRSAQGGGVRVPNAPYGTQGAPSGYIANAPDIYKPPPYAYRHRRIHRGLRQALRPELPPSAFASLKLAHALYCQRRLRCRVWNATARQLRAKYRVASSHKGRCRCQIHSTLTK
jgi:hypothetical protein